MPYPPGRFALRAALITAIVVSFLAARMGTASAATPLLQLDRVIHTNPFDGTSTTMRDAEGSTYVAGDDALWVLDDVSGQAYEVDRQTGVLGRVISNAEFVATPGLTEGGTAGPDRAADLESMAYDPAADAIYVFSGSCCTSAALPTAFRLSRGGDGEFRPDSYQALPTGTDSTAAAINPSDGKLYVGVNNIFRQYSYETNTSSSSFGVSGLSGILGMGFSDDGADLYVVTSAEQLHRVNWATKTLVSGWSFGLTGFGIGDSRAVERVGDQFYVLDGDHARPSSDPLKFGIYVLDVADDPGPPVADAGLDRTVASLVSFNLDAGGSSDPDGGPLTFTWTQIGGPPVRLRDEQSAAPQVEGVVAPAILSFQVTVTDATGLSDTDEVTITVVSSK